MNYLVAQQKLASAIKKQHTKVHSYCWKLEGNDANSLCRLLSIDEEKMRSLLRLCQVYVGKSDKISINNLQLLVQGYGGEWSYHRAKGRSKECFVLIGEMSRDQVILPKDMHNSEGELLAVSYPVQDKHIRKLSTNVEALLNAATNPPQQVDEQKKVEARSLSPKELIISMLRDLVRAAVKNKKETIAPSDLRAFLRLLNAAVDADAKKLLHSVLSKVEQLAEEMSEDVAVTPDKVGSAAAAIVTPKEGTDSQQPARLLIDDLTAEETGDDTTDATPVDEFLAQLKEEALLQNLLHKRIFEKKERVFPLEHRNGRRLLVVLPPDTQSVASFVEEATRTKWVDVMLNTEERREGMLTYLAKTNKEQFSAVAKRKKISTKNVDMTTAQVVAMARVGNLTDVRTKNLKSFLRNNCGLKIVHSKKELDAIDEEVGVSRTNEDVVFGSTVHEWATSKKKKDKTKPPEQVNYWNASLSNEIEAEIDLHIDRFLQENPKMISTVPKIGYVGDGFKEEGVTVCIGGDHGDKNCPISAKLNLTSPVERKRRKELNYGCPVVQFASVECTKDAYELLDKTIMPTVKKQLLHLKDGAIVTVFHSKNNKKHKSFMVPRSIQEGTMAFRQAEGDDDDSVQMTFGYKNGDVLTLGSLQNLSYFRGIPWFELRAKLVVNQFNELFVGDLAFLAMLTGMNSSSGDYCLLCMARGSEFNHCPHNKKEMRTKEKLTECLEQCIIDCRNCTGKKKPANHEGVNNEGLVEIDPQRIVIPILHCPMGLVDKVLESFKSWVCLYVEKIDHQPTKTRRDLQRLAVQNHKAAIATHKAALQLKIDHPNNAEVKKAEKAADKARKKARKDQTESSEKYKPVMRIHNVKKKSLNQKFEDVYRKNGVKREHYHGGKFNGMNCIKTMDKADETFIGTADKKGFLDWCKEKKLSDIDEQTLRTKVEKYARLLGILDAIWSNVRGVEAGLLPTKEQQQQLDKACDAGKKLWIELGISTLQPKWHLTFDGHLVEQVRKFEGLADKADDIIEKFHQVLKELRTRFRSIPSYKVRETCIRRELRRKKSLVIKREVDKYEAAKRQSSGTKRKVNAQQRNQTIREAKKAKRESAVLP